MLRYIDDEHRALLTDSLMFLKMSGRLKKFNEAVRAKVSARNNGLIPVREQFTSLFLDGTRQQCCRYKLILKILTSNFFAKFIFSPMIVHLHSNI